MLDSAQPGIPKWPFIAGDALLLAGAWAAYTRAPEAWWGVALMAGLVLAGAVLACLPFIVEYRGSARMAESATLAAALPQMKTLAASIETATSLWTNVQTEAARTAQAAKSVADGMTTEVKSFAEFMQRMNDTEKAALRLESEKLKRAEGDWLLVIVRMLDHVSALHSAAVRSGQPTLIEQITHFQNACRDAARRVGLSPLLPAENEPFHQEKHQVPDGETAPGAGAVVRQTIAPGYTFQGKLLRPALVRVEPPSQPSADRPA